MIKGARRTDRYAIYLLISYALGTRAQTTNATCPNNVTTSWMFNKDGSSPCLIWSQIQSLCLPSESYINVPPLLEVGNAYTRPKGDICTCNTISYSLMAGCTFCQIGVNGNWQSSSEWKRGCEGWVIDGLGFEEDVVDLPPFVWFDWNDGRWDPVTAERQASNYADSKPQGQTSLSRSFASPTQTVPTPTQTSSQAPSATISTTTNDNSGGSSKAEKWGPIIGGITGGIILLVLLGFLLRRYLNGKNMNKDKTKYTDPAEGETGNGQRQSSHSLLGLFKKDRDMKRETELIIHPLTFKNPRPAPKPRLSSSVSTFSRSKDAVYPDMREQGRYGVNHLESPLPSSHSDDSLSLRQELRPNFGAGEPTPNVLLKSSGKLQKSRLPPSSTDFSAPRSMVDSPTRTLPSLYDPPTGAPTYRETTFSSYSRDSNPLPARNPSNIPINPLPAHTRPQTRETLTSPISRYPASSHFSDITITLDESPNSIAKALGSGRRHLEGRASLRDDQTGYWSRQSLPPVPRNISDDSRS